MGGYTSKLPDQGQDRGVCTQVVVTMKNPDTGETVQATDGCQVSDLKNQGWAPAAEAQDTTSTVEEQSTQRAGGVVTLAIAGTAVYGIYKALAANR